MATSNSTDYRTTAQQIVEDALREINVIREDEAVADGDQQFCLRKLNRMIKFWQAQDVHLWTKELATVFLQKGQREYILNSTGDHATISYTDTSLDADYAAAVTQVSFNDNVTAAVNDYIGIILDANSIHWTTISNVVDPNTVDITDALPSIASEDNNVYIYTTRLDQPFNIYSAIRSNDSEIDVPMFLMSYQEYFDQPNKESQSTAVNWMYDRQRDSARIYVWPTPADVEYRMQISIARKLQDIDSVSNTTDFPQEWEEALVLNLAVRLAPSYGKSKGEDFATLRELAAEALETALLFDSEQGSIFLQPNNYG